MKVLTFALGALLTNTYICIDEASESCIVIDPGLDGDGIYKKITERGLTLTDILLTHGHFDHCSAVRPLLEKYDVPVYIHRADATDRQGHDLMFQRVDEQHQRYYDEGDTLTLGELTIRVMHTPGHSKGSVCLVVNDVIFAGDTLFRASCGRTDFPGGDYREMLASLARLGRMEGNFHVYSGHESDTELDYERRVNPYMKQGMSL